jgi:hypothetical protein
MALYDILVGMDNTELNLQLANIYSALYPKLFKGEFPINEFNFASLDFDVQGAPIADLTPSTSAHAEIEQALGSLEESEALSPELRARLVDQAVTTTFGITAQKMQLRLNFANDQKPIVAEASLDVTASITTGTDTNGHSYVTLQVITGSFNVPENPGLESLVNGFMGKIIKNINANVLAPFKIPPFQYNSLTVSPPVPVIQNGYVLAFAALGTTQPDPPDPYTWPNMTVFFGSDAAVLVAAANTKLPLGPSEGFSWWKITGSVGAQLGPLQSGSLTINGDGSLSVSMPCAAWAQLVLHTPWPLPDFSFGPSATAFVSATATPSVSSNVLMVQINQVDPPIFTFSWGNIPDWVAPLLSPMLDLLADALGLALVPLITQNLRLLQFPVLTLPNVPVTIDNSTYVLSIMEASTSAGEGPQGPLLLVTGQPYFGPGG